jgi:hypothetical protein
MIRGTVAMFQCGSLIVDGATASAACDYAASLRDEVERLHRFAYGCPDCGNRHRPEDCIVLHADNLKAEIRLLRADAEHERQVALKHHKIAGDLQREVERMRGVVEAAFAYRDTSHSGEVDDLIVAVDELRAGEYA